MYIDLFDIENEMTKHFEINDHLNIRDYEDVLRMFFYKFEREAEQIMKRISKEKTKLKLR